MQLSNDLRQFKQANKLNPSNVLTLTNPKVLKSESIAPTAVLHLLPTKAACPAAGTCALVCLNTAGNPAYLKGKLACRARRDKAFRTSPNLFLRLLTIEVLRFYSKNSTNELLGLRLNGTSDIDWNIHGLYEEFKQVKFYDYTKIYKRALKYVKGCYPKNYHLTYSLNEDNKNLALDILKRGGNISAVFRSKKLPKKFLNYKVFNGDKSDLRFNDPKNVIIGLYAKGRALKDNTGFVQDV